MQHQTAIPDRQSRLHFATNSIQSNKDRQRKQPLSFWVASQRGSEHGSVERG